MKTRSVFTALVAGSLLTIGMAANAQYAPHQDLDRDGIQNRYDGDRDGDRIPNARDPNPNVPNVVRHERNDRHARNDRYGPYGDLDRDGIQNRADHDRDGDGVRNARDRYPDDRRYA